MVSITNTWGGTHQRLSLQDIAWCDCGATLAVVIPNVIRDPVPCLPVANAAREQWCRSNASRRRAAHLSAGLNPRAEEAGRPPSSGFRAMAAGALPSQWLRSIAWVMDLCHPGLGCPGTPYAGSQGSIASGTRAQQGTVEGRGECRMGGGGS